MDKLDAVLSWKGSGHLPGAELCCDLLEKEEHKGGRKAALGETRVSCNGFLYYMPSHTWIRNKSVDEGQMEHARYDERARLS